MCWFDEIASSIDVAVLANDADAADDDDAVVFTPWDDDMRDCST